MTHDTGPRGHDRPVEPEELVGKDELDEDDEMVLSGDDLSDDSEAGGR